jgi:apolipoprotein N-acyltransferase
MITWQTRRRTPSRGLAVAAGLLVIPGITGAGLMWAQQSGLVHLEGPLRLLPIGLVLLAIGVQIIAVTRAALRWLGG